MKPLIRHFLISIDIKKEKMGCGFMLGFADEIVNNYLDEALKFGYIKGGHNGPYYDPETPVRNTANWITIFAYYFKTTSDQKYLAAVNKLAHYLISKEARPMKASFYSRTNKTLSNGLIGSAWAIQGLLSAYEVTGNNEYLNVSDEVFSMFVFNNQNAMWKILEVDGTQTSIYDTTLNHQIWFAAAGYEIYSRNKNDEILEKINAFFDCLSNKFRIYPSGLIKHGMYPNYSKLEKCLAMAKKTRDFSNTLRRKKIQKYKEHGYHIFNLYALAIIYDLGYRHGFYESSKFRKSVEFVCSDNLKKSLEEKLSKEQMRNMTKVKSTDVNIFGYGYNVPGFEAPYVLSVFKDKINNCDEHITFYKTRQLELTFDRELKRFMLNTEDQRTLESRLCEYIRYLTSFKNTNVET